MFSPLPFPLGSLHGRELELERLDALLAGGARLVTLTGLGGVGKSRLAVAAARQLSRDRAIAYCDVAAATDVIELAFRLAGSLAVDLPPDTCASMLMSALGTALATREPLPTLVVIDNFERLVGLPEEAAVLGLRDCLERVPWLSALVTSRVALPRSIGFTIAVHPIDSVGPDSAAVKLLVARADLAGGLSSWQRRDPSLEQLARRLEGLPLALELAAARAHLLCPADLLALLDEQSVIGEEKERLSGAVVAWSWGALASEHQESLRRLEVIDGSFGFELAAALIRGGRGVALQTLEALVAVSLVMVDATSGAARYRMLEAVREFVRAKMPLGRTDAHDDLSRALMAPLPIDDEITLATAFDSSYVLAEREAFLGVVRRGLLPGAGLRSLTLALRAATWLLLALRRSGFAPAIGERVETLLEHADIERVPLALRISASLLTVTVRVSEVGTGEVDPLLARVDRWAREAGCERARVKGLVLRGVVAHYRWDYQAMHRIGAELVAHPLFVSELGLLHGAVQYYLNARRALGLAEFAADDALAADAVRRLFAMGELANAHNLQCNRAFFAVQMGHPEEALRICADLESAGVAIGDARLGAMAQRERARAEVDLGLRHQALATFDAAITALGPTREAVEARLERCAVALEAGRYDEVRRDLFSVRSLLATNFERGYHGALTRALAQLMDEPNDGPASEPTNTVEDTAFRLLASLGARAPAALAPLAKAATAHEACSFRVRQARRLFDAAQALSAGSDTVLGIDLEARAFRFGRQWVRLDKKPLLATLVNALARARMEGEAGIDRLRLEALAWPDAKVAREFLDRRLETAVSAIRKLGLRAIDASEPVATRAGDAEAAGAHRGDTRTSGYTLAPNVVVLRVKMSAWTSGELPAPARGRGRRRV